MRSAVFDKVRPGKWQAKSPAVERGPAWSLVWGVLLLWLAGLGLYWMWNAFLAGPPPAREAPEAEKVLAVQATMPFQILIPAYMPKEFDRAAAQISVDGSGPGGEPMVQLAYRTRAGGGFFIRQWVPGDPSMEILANSRPIETKWGKGWLLESRGMYALWVDLGPLRTSLYSASVDIVTREQLLGMANSLGPASNRQVFSFLLEQPQIKEVAPPAPVEVKTNAQGVQELTLVVTPGGYTPLRFQVKKGVPVKIVFRQLGQVGCGNELIFPADPQNPSSLKLDSEQDQEVLEFTPKQTGQFEFHCSHLMYRGVMFVTE